MEYGNWIVHDYVFPAGEHLYYGGVRVLWVDEYLDTKVCRCKCDCCCNPTYETITYYICGLENGKYLRVSNFPMTFEYYLSKNIKVGEWEYRDERRLYTRHTDYKANVALPDFTRYRSISGSWLARLIDSCAAILFGF